MKNNSCNHECEYGNCPFMTDPYDSDRQVCVKCGSDYSFRRYGWNHILFFAALIAAILMVIRNPEKSEPEIEPVPVESELQVDSQI